MSHQLPDEIDGIPAQRGYESVYVRWFMEVIDDHHAGCICASDETTTGSAIRFSRPVSDQELDDWTRGHWVPGVEGRQ